MWAHGVAQREVKTGSGSRLAATQPARITLWQVMLYTEKSFKLTRDSSSIVRYNTDIAWLYY